MKIVVDTNVLVSALIKPRGIPAQIMAHQASFDVVFTEGILSELERVLRYPRIKKKYSLRDQAIKAYVESLRHGSSIIEITKPVTGVSEDPDPSVRCPLSFPQTKYLLCPGQLQGWASDCHSDECGREVLPVH